MSPPTRISDIVKFQVTPIRIVKCHQWTVGKGLALDWGMQQFQDLFYFWIIDNQLHSLHLVWEKPCLFCRHVEGKADFSLFKIICLMIRSNFQIILDLFFFHEKSVEDVTMCCLLNVLFVPFWMEATYLPGQCLWSSWHWALFTHKSRRINYI